MSEIILKCINHVISVVNTPDISSGNVNYDTVLFELCPNWTDYTKTAVFYRTEDEAYYQLLDSDNRCTIPKEVLREKGKIYIGLFGVNGDKTITSDVITYKVREGAITTGLKPSDPTPDIYAQLIGQYSNLGAEIDVERKRIDSIVSGATVDANAELIDIRVGADGTVYDSAGDAVRSQFKKIKEVNSLAIVNEASGKEIIATDSSDNVFKNLKVYGETTQKLGKNLIKCDAPPMGIGYDGITYKGVYETPIGGGELQYIEVSGIMTPLNMNDGTTDVETSHTIGEVTLGAGEYIFSQGFTTGTRYPHLLLFLDGVEYSNLLTAPEKSFTLTKSTVVRLDIEILAMPDSEIPTTKVYPMIRLASETDGTYEPYNGVYPTPENPKAVKSKTVNRVDVLRKNLLNCNGLTAQTLNGITFTPIYENGLLKYVNVNGTATALTQLIINTDSLLDKDYILNGCPSSGSNSTYRLDCFYSGSDSSNDVGLGVKITGKKGKTLSVRILVFGGVTVSNAKFYPMIRRASITDNTYEPYKKESANLSGIELHGLGDVKDYIDMERGVIVRKCGVNTFDGSESWSGSSFLSGRYGLVLNAKGKAQAQGKCMCTMAKNATNDLVGYCHINQSGAFYINTSFATVNEWKAHLQANPMTVVYELATPIEEPLSDANLLALRELHSYKPTTVLTNDAGAYMELEYVADTKLYIDKRISELATAILNN